MDSNIAQQDQARLMASAMNFVGSNTQANEMFNTALNAVGDNQGLKGMMLMGLSGAGTGGDGMTPDVAQNRLNYLNTLEPQFANDQNMLKTELMLCLLKWLIVYTGIVFLQSLSNLEVTSEKTEIFSIFYLELIFTFGAAFH